MNEFIVWDKIENRFIGLGRAWTTELRQCILPQIDVSSDYKSFTFKNRFYHHRELDLEYFQYIGKTDMEGNKIYADCSIVEFEYNDDVFSYQATGYFTYDSEIASYVLIDDAKNIEQLSKKCVTNIKVIGTLQENPELL